MSCFSRNKPLVVVTGPHKRLRFGWWGTRFMLWLAGLRGCYVTAQRRKLPDGVRGVIIGGGDDIDPQHYGITGDAGATYDMQRDALEMDLLRTTLQAELPVLGICRGAQLINVVLGGNLHGDIRPLRKKTLNYNTLFPVKWVDVEADTRLAEALEKSSVKVNSLHNQAIDKLADSLVITARDRDDFVQAVEHSRRNFMVGVQWHPEYLPYLSSQRRLFKAFADAVQVNLDTLPETAD